LIALQEKAYHLIALQEKTYHSCKAIKW
jgi:hypothetical protein